MKIDAFGAGIELHRAGDRARDFAAIGYDGLWVAEAGRTAYLTCAATALAATWDEFPQRIADKYSGVADRIILYFATEAWEKGPEHFDRWRELIGHTHALTGES